jgi:hypothetical protein
MRASRWIFLTGFFLTTLTAAPSAVAVCNFEPDAPDCTSCFLYHQYWNPWGAWIQDIAERTVDIQESCTVVDDGGQPYYEMVLGCLSSSQAQVASSLIWTLDQLDLPSPLHGREEWCSETVSFWHREAEIPYDNGYFSPLWHHNWQNYSVAEMKTWYETEEALVESPLQPFAGRGRWISYRDLDYENFELGVTVPVPGSYMSICGMYFYLANSAYWKDLGETGHSLMIDEMTIHLDSSGDVFQVEATFLEGNSGKQVTDGRYLDDLLKYTPAGTGWIPTERKIYGFGVDLDEQGDPIYDPSRLHYEYHPAVLKPPYLEPADVADPDWEQVLAQRTSRLRAYARMVAQNRGPAVSSTGPVQVSGMPDNHSVEWVFPGPLSEPVQVVVDLLDEHPVPIQGLALRWSGSLPPYGYRVQYAGKDGKWVEALVPEFPTPAGTGSPPLAPISFSDTGGKRVRYLRFLFPAGSFFDRTTLRELTFFYDFGPFEDSADNPIGPPTFSPVADAGDDRTLPQQGTAGTSVRLDGSGSSDDDSTPGTNDDIVSFDWYEAGEHLGSGEVLNHTFPLGVHQVSLTVVDRLGHLDGDTVRIRIVEQTGCVAGSTTLCLNQGRFAVEAEWATDQGTSGQGRAVKLTGDTGCFWFFDSANFELMVKVLDACSFTDRFWVFVAGLTNVEVTLTVTDTESGKTKSYHNPRRTPFQPIQDTDAFDTCP